MNIFRNLRNRHQFKQIKRLGRHSGQLFSSTVVLAGFQTYIEVLVIFANVKVFSYVFSTNISIFQSFRPTQNC